MGDFRKRPKGGYMFEANWEELYILTRYWKNDLNFCKEDLLFLRKLISGYFIWITKKENEEMVKRNEKELVKLLYQCDDLLKKKAFHIKQLAKKIQEKLPKRPVFLQWNTNIWKMNLPRL